MTTDESLLPPRPAGVCVRAPALAQCLSSRRGAPCRRGRRAGGGRACRWAVPGGPTIFVKRRWCGACHHGDIDGPRRRPALSSMRSPGSSSAARAGSGDEWLRRRGGRKGLGAPRKCAFSMAAHQVCCKTICHSRSLDSSSSTPKLVPSALSPPSQRRR